MEIEACRPPGGLRPYEGPADWLGEDLVDDESWIRVFSPEEIETIESAGKRAPRGLPGCLSREY
ncbi:MAG: hypothetical protein CME19_25770 [Gemmatimonadetes bacterium]|nr:hypothetical protein [Gemmatimonadota bacterium]